MLEKRFSASSSPPEHGTTVTHVGLRLGAENSSAQQQKFLSAAKRGNSPKLRCIIHIIQDGNGSERAVRKQNGSHRSLLEPTTRPVQDFTWGGGRAALGPVHITRVFLNTCKPTGTFTSHQLLFAESSLTGASERFRRWGGVQICTNFIQSCS